MKLKNLNPTLIICLLLIITSRIATYVAYPKGFRSPDTMTYYSGKFLNFDLVSFTGNSSRGWVVPMIFALMPSSSVLVLFQLLLSALAWVYLTLTLNQVLTHLKIGIFVLICTTVVALAPQTIQHDTVILATSITNSLFVLLLSLLFKITYSKNISVKVYMTFLSVGTMLMLQKTSFFPIVLGVILLGSHSKWRQVNLTKKITASFLILTSIAYALIVGSNVNSSWQVSYSGQTLLWQLGGQSPVAHEFAEYLNKKGVPRCVISDAPYRDLDSSIGKVLNNCPSGVEFLKGGLQREFVYFVISNPGAAVELIVLGAGASATNSATNYGGAVSLLPKFLFEAFFGSTAPNITELKVENQVEGMNLINSNQPFWIYSPIFGWILMALIGFFARKNLHREELTLYFALVLNISQSALVVLLLPSEWVRQTSPYSLGILILSVFLTAKTFDAIFGSAPKRGS